MAEMEVAAALRYLGEMIVLTAQAEEAKEGIRSVCVKGKPEWQGP